jgi:hypothetical protein
LPYHKKMVKFPTMKSTSLRTVQEVVAVLGGNEHLATTLGTTNHAVSNWRARGEFPAHTYLALQAMLKRRGYRAPGSLWAMTRAKRA